MTYHPEFASPCGLYCGVCAIYMADRDDNEKFKQSLVRLYQGGVPGKGTLPESGAMTTADIHCKGCLSDDRFMFCENCSIRDCAQDRGIEGCHDCEDFPCAHINDFPMAVGKKVILRSVAFRKAWGTAEWIRQEEERYVCPQCGNKVFRGVTRCNQCKHPLDLD